MKPRFSLTPRLAAAIAALLCCVFAITACSRPMVRYRYDPLDGEPRDFKRREAYPQRDFFHRFTRTVYREADRIEYFYDTADSKTQQLIMDEWGLPDYVRKPFESLQGEPIDEWLYVDQRQVFQFVDGELVYEGPLTDHEMILMQHGYPDRIDVVRRNTYTNDITFTYNGVFGGGLDFFKFYNDKLIMGVEDN